MKKYSTLIYLLFFSFSVYSQNNNSYSHQGYYYSNNESIYWIDDSTSANIIISNVNHFDQIVKNLMNVFTNPSDLIYYDLEDDNILIYSNNLPFFNKDSLLSLISIDTNDISFFTYSKIVNNSHIWLRNEVLVRFKQPVLLSTLEQQLLDFDDIQIFNESNNEYSIICKYEQDLIEISNILYDTNYVYYSCPDFYGMGSLNTNDTYYSNQWGLNNSGGLGFENVDINAPEAWNFLNALGLNYGGDIKIAVIDDGVEPHEDLYQNGISKVMEGYTANGNGTGRPCSDCNHGMSCAGIIAATHNEIGVAGVSPNVKIVPIRIFKSGNLFADFFDFTPMYSNKNIAKAIRKSWEEFGCSILSNSWSQNYHHDAVKFAINDALEDGRNGLGCIWVNSSGNNNSSLVNYPARYYDKIIVVGAINSNGERGNDSNLFDPWYTGDGSNYGEKLDVVAPGTNISTIDKEGYSGWTETNYDLEFTGTSAACPFVSGIAALILTVNPTLTNQQVNNIIESTTKKVGVFNYQNISGRNNGTWHEEVGYGLVDAYSAVKKAVFGNGGTIIGNPSIDVCEVISYNYLGQVLPSSVLIEWETSPNFAIISGQGTNNVTIRVISTTELNPYIKINFYSNSVLLHTISKQVAITGNLIYPSIVLSNTTINQNTIWSNEGFLGVNVTITNNATLTISNSLYISSNAKIIVQPGGKLVLDGGKLTNYCTNNPWQGIVIEGNNNQSQMGITPNQGIVIVKNNAIIENAICGIKVGVTQDPSKNGGIVYASETQFKNCKNGVLFAPYKNMNNNVELANRSKFTDCEFIVDDNFYTAGMFFDAHVKLLGVNGITLTGCSFSNAQTTSFPSARRYASSGILSFNSGFTVQPKCLSNLIPGEICTQNDIEIESTFTGLDYGIVAQGGDDFYKISVLSTQFNKNDYGIYLSGVNNAKILNNSFTIGKDINNIVSNPVGLYIQNGSGFRIEENVFVYNPSINLARTGLVVKNSGKENNQIYNNSFMYLTDGQVFDGLNYSTKNPFEGLVSLCNKNTGNKVNDFWVRTIDGYNYNGINQYQGEVFNTGSMMNNVAAGNTFSNLIWPDIQYKNDGNYLFYMYYPNNSNEILYSYSSSTISREIATENFCPSKINGLNIQTIQSELTNITFNYGNLKYNYNQLIDAGNTPELIRLIQDEWSEDIWNLRIELLGKSPYLSQEAIISAAQENLLPPALLLEICIANPDATRDQGFLDILRYGIPTPLPEFMINLIIASWDERTLRTEIEEQLAAFKTYKDEYQNYKTEFLLSDTIYNYTDIIIHLGTRGSYSDYLSMAEIAINQDDFVQANLYLDILEYNTEKLTSEEVDEISSFREYISIRESILLDTTTIYNLDSTQIAALELFASSNNYRGAILARNILCFLYDLCIDDVPAPPKMLRIGSNGNNSQNTTPFIASVKVMPNPAHEYASFIWDMKSFDKNAILYIYDQDGKIVVTQPIDTKQGQWVWNIKNVPNGVYVYTLKSEQLILYSGKIIVNK